MNNSSITVAGSAQNEDSSPKGEYQSDDKINILTTLEALLQLIEFNVFRSIPTYQALIRRAREQLEAVRIHPSTEPQPDSLAHFAFDPYIARRLNTFVPIRVLPIPPQEQTWELIESFFSGWYEQSLLAATPSILTWNVSSLGYPYSPILRV